METLIIQLSKKLARTTGIFFKIRHSVTLHTFKLLHCSLFCSFTSYRISVWGLTHPTTLMPLYRVQKNIITAISFSDHDKYATSSPLFQTFEILKLNELHTFNLLCFVFQCNQDTSIGPFQNYFVPLTSVYDYNTRKASKGDMYVSGINTAQYGKRTARCTGAILWNNLNINIRLRIYIFLKSGQKNSTLNILYFVFWCNQDTSIGLLQNYFLPLTSVYDYNTRKASKGDMYVSCINTAQYGKKLPNIQVQYYGTI